MPSIEIPKKPGGTASRTKMLFVTEQGRRIEMPFAPLEVQHSDIGMGFVELARPGRAPLLEKSGRRLPTMTMSCVVTIDGQFTSIEPLLGSLKELAESGDKVTVAYGPSEAGWWRCTKLDYKSVHRSTLAITWADVDVSFQRADDGTVSGVGPLSGGAVEVGHKTASTKSGTPVFVKKGETLTGIAARVYGSPSKWPLIAKANGITDPRKLKAGQTLVIP